MTGSKLKITFVLPGRGDKPVGGPKVVYEYANHLSRRGHKVSIVHPARSCQYGLGLTGNTKNWLRYFQIAMGMPFRPDHWFQVDPEVNMVCVPNLSERWIPKGDIVVATAWQTAEWACGYSRCKGRGFYLIQHLETWCGPEDKVFKTWKTPLSKIVIAKWLQEIATGLHEEASYIPNGLNMREFQMDISPLNRDAMSIFMLYHESDWKGSSDGIEALKLVRQMCPEIRVALFGVPPRPSSLPEWIEYYREPQRELLRKLYNQSAIFVSPSWAEGWPLPPAEAMLCGAALVATDIGGHREYASHGDTALLCPIKNPRGLAQNILTLVRDGDLRLRLANNGHKYIKQFTWDLATNRLESLFQNSCFGGVKSLKEGKT